MERELQDGVAEETQEAEEFGVIEGGTHQDGS